jgi:hypothetical protein
MSTSAYIGMGVESGVSNILNTATMDNATTIPWPISVASPRKQ